MSLPHALLGLISYKPETGYELKARFENSIHNFWNATLPQIYRTLNQMKEAGWLTCSVEHQDGKPSRKVYSLSDAGREEFLRWLEEPPEFGQLRDTMLIKVFFGNQLGREKLAVQLRGWRDYHRKVLHRYEHESIASIDQLNHIPALKDDIPYWKLTLDCGIQHTKALIGWCEQTLKTLES